MSTLTLIFALPLLAAIGLVFVPRNLAVIARAVACGVTFVTMVLGILMFCQFNSATADTNGYKFVSTIPWLGAESLGIACKFGVDGLNVGLVLMGAIVAFAAACCSFEIKSREKEFYILLLTMTGGILGAFMSTDLFFFYFFHELALVPTFIMIGVSRRTEEFCDVPDHDLSEHRRVAGAHRTHRALSAIARRCPHVRHSDAHQVFR
jgi:NADH-quinone oxidoreductase subunit M